MIAPDPAAVERERIERRAALIRRAESVSRRGDGWKESRRPALLRFAVACDELTALMVAHLDDWIGERWREVCAGHSVGEDTDAKFRERAAEIVKGQTKALRQAFARLSADAEYIDGAGKKRTAPRWREVVDFFSPLAAGKDVPRVLEDVALPVTGPTWEAIRRAHGAQIASKTYVSLFASEQWPARKCVEVERSFAAGFTRLHREYQNHPVGLAFGVCQRAAADVHYLDRGPK